MKRIAAAGLGLCLLFSVRQGRGQETDSVFFQTTMSAYPPDSGARRGVALQRATAQPFMTTRIHFTGDFIRRFNEQPTNDNPPQPKVPGAREGRIRSLFNSEDPRLARLPMGQESAYAGLVRQFAETIGGSWPPLVLTDPNAHLYAAVPATVMWRQREEALMFYLKKSRIGTNWAWEIIGTDAIFLPLVADTTGGQSSCRDSLVFIPPNAHELYFMGLAKQLRSGTALSQFISPAAAHDARLGTVSCGLSTGQLQLKALLPPTLWLDTQFGWWLQLRQFNRETDNSGWLISDLCRPGAGDCLPPVFCHFMTDTAVTVTGKP